MRFTGPIKATVSVDDGTVDGECVLWNLFIAVCVKSKWRSRDFHKKHLLGNTKFDVCVGPEGNINVLMLSTQNMATGNIEPNVKFTVEVVLNINNIDFILTPDLDEGTKYYVGIISKHTYKTWKKHAYVEERFERTVSR